MKTATLKRLLNNLHRVFDKSPGDEPCLVVNYSFGPCEWMVADSVLTITAGVQAVDDGQFGSNMIIDLAGHTLASLAVLIGSKSGYSASVLTAEQAGLSALILLNGRGSAGTVMSGYTSILWSYMTALAQQIDDARSELTDMLDQMTIGTASGYWLDELGGYYAVPRLPGELDQIYGPRIIAETIRPKSNNYAISLAIKTTTGQPSSVIDCSDISVDSNLFDGSWSFDGARFYSSSTMSSTYGLFDVLVAYDILGQKDMSGFLDDVRDQVERLRAAGTHLRQIMLGSAGPITDAFPDQSIDHGITLGQASGWTYNGAVAFDGSRLFGTQLIGAETF